MKFEPGGPPRYRHQRQGLRKIIETNGVCALLFDPGTGKTATALDFAGVLALKKGVARVLVVAPLAAIDTWVLQAAIYVSPQVHYWAEALGGTIRERSEALASRGGDPFRATKFRKGQARDAAYVQRSLAWNASIAMDPKFGPGALPDDRPHLIIEVINMDTLSSRAARGSVTMADVFLNGFKRFNPDLVIVDESHKIKSASGNTSRLLDRMGSRVSHRMLLTGTVMPHSPLDIYAQWRFLDPYAFGFEGRTATWEGFKTQYAVMGGFMGKEAIGYQNLDKMQDIMARSSMVVRKADALDLPPTKDVIVPVDLSAKERKAYDQMRESLAATLDLGEVNVPNRLTQMLRLRQITSGHLPLPDKSLAIIGDSKVRVINSIVNDTLEQERRLVVFSFFTHEVHALAEMLANKNTQVETITGATKSSRRLQIRARFGLPAEADPQRIVLVAQIKTISLSVNELVTANHAIFGSLSQQRDDLIQARDRLDRIGQTVPVTFWFPMVPGTVDEVIFHSHQRRTNLENAMLRHIKEVQ